DDAEIGELEDRSVRILVDRDDHARTLHTDLVLDRARDTAGDVELRRDSFSRLADLRRVRVPPRVDDGACRADGTAQRFCQIFDEGEVLGSPETATARHD